MGLLTDFFVASPDELRSIFPAWLPVANQPVTREFHSRITGKKQTALYWPPAIHAPQSVTPESLGPNYQNVMHVEFKRVDHVKLAQLNVILSGGEFQDRFKQFNRPALIDPNQTYEAGLHCLDEEFVRALAAITQANNIAQHWAEIEEMQMDQFTVEDCEIVLGELIRLAQHANATDKQLYFWWCL